MTLREQIQSDVAAVFLNTDEFAESVSYTPLGGAATPIDGIFSGDEHSAEDVSDGREKLRRGRLRISRSDVANPGHGDTVSINSEDWFVAGVIEQDDYMALLDVERATTIERTAPGYRRRD